MKIAYIGIKGLPSQAGADRVVEAIVQRLSGRHEITVYCSPLAVPAGAAYPGIDLVRVPILPGKHAHATSLFLASALHALARRSFDLVHIHNVEACFTLPFLKLRYKTIATSHGQAYARGKWGKAAKQLLRLADWPYIHLADCATSVSKPLADDYTQCHGRQIVYIPNGVEPYDEEASIAAARDLLRTCDVQPGSYLLFAAGRIIPTKGAETVLEAHRALPSPVKLLMVGDTGHVPEYERELHAMAGEQVVFIPAVDKLVLLGLVRLAHTFLFPSTYEAMSMMLLEAASVGTPIVCSDIAANVAVLPDEVLYFRAGDAGDLKDKLLWALDHPEAMAASGRCAQARVHKEFCWDTIVEQYEDLYQTVAKKY